MPYNLPSDVQNQISRHIATGQYASEDDVLRAALRALGEHHEELAAIQAGIDDLEAGRVRPVEDVDADLRRQFGSSKRAMTYRVLLRDELTLGDL